ncbi:MAG: metallophosphoesterase family protein [Nitrospinae bacterium]|nr:metallophosphoesterase family protein [Nitrospinota bacterium]
MRYALFSDIHANIDAFDEVLADIEATGVDKKLFLGDIVGYGPDPQVCIDRLLEVADVSLGGNHDWAAVGLTSADYFNPYAKAALDWTISQLREDQVEFLKRTQPSLIYDGFQLAHSSPLAPAEWRYILNHQEALDNYPYIEHNLCFIGHSHQPLVIEYTTPQTVRVLRPSPLISLDPDIRYIVNIGSVGQPRDSIVESCWVLFDSEERTVSFRRVPYDVETVQRKMEAHDLPRYLIDRLALGR